MHCLTDTYKWLSNILTLGRGKILQIYLTPRKYRFLKSESVVVNLVRTIFNVLFVVWCKYFFCLSSFTFNNKEESSRWFLVKDDINFLVSKCKSTCYLIMCSKAHKESHEKIPTNDDSPQLLYSGEEFVWN